MLLRAWGGPVQAPGGAAAFSACGSTRKQDTRRGTRLRRTTAGTSMPLGRQRRQHGGRAARHSRSSASDASASRPRTPPRWRGKPPGQSRIEYRLSASAGLAVPRDALPLGYQPSPGRCPAYPIALAAAPGRPTVTAAAAACPAQDWAHSRVTRWGAPVGACRCGRRKVRARGRGACAAPARRRSCSPTRVRVRCRSARRCRAVPGRAM